MLKSMDAFSETSLFETGIYAEMRQKYDIAIFKAVGKGLSNDKKYYIETIAGQRLLLRTSDISKYDRKKSAYNKMRQMAAADVPMSRPVDFGICDGGKQVYQLLTWCDGENLEEVFQMLSETEQYTTGLKVGEALRKIHSVSAQNGVEDWQMRYVKVIGERIQAFLDCGVQFDGWESIIKYYEDNLHLLKGRPQTSLHGDLHAENIMLADNGDVSVIDWEILDYEGYGDPWADFRSDKCDESPHYITGCIHGYFRGEPPTEFWMLNTFYTAVGSITSIPWAYYKYPSELEPLIKHNLNVLRWYDNMRNPVPTWYLKDFYIQWVDGIPYKLKSPFDFSFLRKYGKVFKVFDNQGSGNICFGIADDEKQYFVKFAGAPTESYTGAAENAVERLKRAVPAYEDLAHPNLIKLIKAEDKADGYVAIFDWVDAVHMWAPVFKNLPLDTRYTIFDDILDFHALVAKKGYCVLDLYEDHILWDIENEKAVICDIDFYSKGWYEGMSGIWNPDCEWYFPEQFIDGASIDEISSVYVMGAVAFALFGDGQDRCLGKWKLSEELFAVANRAVSGDRGRRQQSIEQLIKEWRAVR